MRLFYLIFIFIFSFNSNANANEWWDNKKIDLKETWYQSDKIDLYFPSITWHARFAYNKEKAENYNEKPDGFGLGKSRFDENGNWHGFYIMAFKDSYSYIEPIAGYGYENIWRPFADDKFRLGLGYTAGLTARHNWNYIPIPLVLPLASIGYGPATFQMTYIPGTYNNGNVYFAWFRLSL